MTDYAQASAADPSWTWWMTTAAAAVRLRNLQHHHGDGSGSCSDVDDDYAGPGGKRQRVGDVKDGCWRFDRNDRGGLLLRHRLEPDDTASAGPLDLSVKATLTTTAAAAAAATATARVVGKRTGSDGYPAATTPEKRPTAAATANRGKSSKKTAAGGTAASTTAVKAATRKLLPQLMLDRHVDRSSPVSGTIIVPAAPEEPTTAAGRKRLASSSPSLSSSSSLSSPPYSTAADCGGQDGDPRDDEYDGGDIDPEFNVVVATDEARRQIESIPNALGPYRCRLCGVRYVDAFALARHRCRCIVHVRYTCPECDKVFQCPANLASHRRWHGTGTSVKTTGAGKNGKTGDNIGAKPVNVIASNIVSDVAAIDVNDSDGGGSMMTVPAVTSASGFKKNILQRAVQAAATAAAAGNDNNNNDGDDNDKKQCNNDRGDIAK